MRTPPNGTGPFDRAITRGMVNRSTNLTLPFSNHPHEKSGPMQQRYLRWVELVSTLGFAGYQRFGGQVCAQQWS